MFNLGLHNSEKTYRRSVDEEGLYSIDRLADEPAIGDFGLVQAFPDKADIRHGKREVRLSRCRIGVRVGGVAGGEADQASDVVAASPPRSLDYCARRRG